MKYQFRHGARISGDAQAIGEELHQLSEKHDGELLPECVVQHAQDPQSAMHGCFTWDVDEAAMQYRMEQARRVIRSIEVTVDYEAAGEATDADVSVSRETRAFHHVAHGDEPARYTRLDVVMGSAVLRRHLVAKALKEAIAWSQRYRDINELAGVRSAIDSVQVELEEYLDTDDGEQPADMQ